jgi:hypothetical protein
LRPRVTLSSLASASTRWLKATAVSGLMSKAQRLRVE